MFQYVIYCNPKDYPNKFVVRKWEIFPGKVEAGGVICETNSIEEARESLPVGVVEMPVFEDDDAVIAEVWM